MHVSKLAVLAFASLTAISAVNFADAQTVEESRADEIMSNAACAQMEAVFILNSDHQRVQILAPEAGVKGVQVINFGPKQISASFDTDDGKKLDHPVEPGNTGFWQVDDQRFYIQARGGNTADASGCYRLIF